MSDAPVSNEQHGPLMEARRLGKDYHDGERTLRILRGLDFALAGEEGAFGLQLLDQLRLLRISRRCRQRGRQHRQAPELWLHVQSPRGLFSNPPATAEFRAPPARASWHGRPGRAIGTGGTPVSQVEIAAVRLRQCAILVPLSARRWDPFSKETP